MENTMYMYIGPITGIALHWKSVSSKMTFKRTQAHCKTVGLIFLQIFLSGCYLPVLLIRYISRRVYKDWRE